LPPVLPRAKKKTTSNMKNSEGGDLLLELYKEDSKSRWRGVARFIKGSRTTATFTGKERRERKTETMGHEPIRKKGQL